LSWYFTQLPQTNIVECCSSQFSISSKSALVIAHPGHELRVWRWLELAQPLVFVLTDGSGRSGKSRLGSTTHILRQAGASIGSIFGWMSDVDLYHAILCRDSEFFIGLAETLSQKLHDQQIEYVVGDAIEGYNPAHDLCRLIINLAMVISKQRRRVTLGNFDFLLSGRPDACAAEHHSGGIKLRLNDQALETKLKVARGYRELQDEVDSTLDKYGCEAFRTECLRPVKYTNGVYDLQERPFYERYGEKQVAAGLYRDVIRYREHMIPVAEALRHHAKRV
jgi:hypothetical protein